MALGAQDQEDLKEISQLVGEIRALRQKPQGLAFEDRTKLDKMQEALDALNARIGERAAPERLGEYDVHTRKDANRIIGVAAEDGGAARALDAMLKVRTRDPELCEVQEAIDDAFIVYSLTGVLPFNQRKFRQDCRELPMLKRTVTTGTESTWIPVALSSQIHEKIRLALKVSALHDRITMPTDPFKLPLEGKDADLYIVLEQGEPDAELIPGSRIPNGMTPNAGTGVMTLASKKLGTRLVFSEELTEDAVTAMTPYFRGKVIRTFADGQEIVTINGDTAVTHMDGSMAANDPRKAWDGYRKSLLSSTKVTSSVTFGAVTTADLRKTRKTMGKYSINPSDLAWVTGPQGWHMMLSIPEVLTVDKLGDRATLLSGQQGSFDGVPIIVSEHVREDLNAFGFYDGITTNRTQILLVRRDAFIYGDRRDARLRSREIIETEQIVLAGTQRLTMGNWFAGLPISASLIAI